jgi:hypothetical protein
MRQNAPWFYGAVLAAVLGAGLLASIMLGSEPLPPPAMVISLATVTPTPAR